MSLPPHGSPQPPPGQPGHWAPGPPGGTAGYPGRLPVAPPVRPEPVAPVAVPRQLTWAGGLLLVNLLLSVSVTVVSWINRDDLVAMTADAAGGAVDAESFAEQMLVLRSAGNLAVAVLYAFLMWGAWRGKRWAWRRLVWLAFAGAAALGYLLTQPYTPLLKAQQGVQIVVLLALGAVLLHPAIRAHCAKRRR